MWFNSRRQYVCAELAWMVGVRKPRRVGGGGISVCRGSAVGKFRKGEKPCVAVVRRTEVRVTHDEVVEIQQEWEHEVTVSCSGLQALLGLYWRSIAEEQSCRPLRLVKTAISSARSWRSLGLTKQNEVGRWVERPFAVVQARDDRCLNLIVAGIWSKVDRFEIHIGDQMAGARWRGVLLMEDNVERASEGTFSPPGSRKWHCYWDPGMTLDLRRSKSGLGCLPFTIPLKGKQL